MRINVETLCPSPLQGATGEPMYAAAESKLVEFLAKTQVVSEAHPELSGAWFRAFDYERWEYWASDNDWG